MVHSQFSVVMTPDEFLQLYWYRVDLACICRELSLNSRGTKFELQERVVAFLRTGKRVPDFNKPAPFPKKVRKNKTISLETSIVADGFKLNHESRAFFADYFNRKKFLFTKEMARAVRHARRSGDVTFTVSDLIEVYKQGRKSYPDEVRTFLWNGFVKSFSKDSRTKDIKNKFEIAALLWSKVRNSKFPKVYTCSLFDRYWDEIEQLIQYKAPV